VILPLLLTKLASIAATLAIAACSGKEYAALFKDLDESEVPNIIAFLQENKYEYKLENDGLAILVPKNDLYEVQTVLAIEGLKYKNDCTEQRSNYNYDYVKAYIEKEAYRILSSYIYPNKAVVTIYADLDYGKIDSIVEKHSSIIPPGCDCNVYECTTRAEEQLINNRQTVIKRLVVSAFIDNSVKEELTQLTQVVKNAIGYSHKRNDSVYVALIPLNLITRKNKEFNCTYPRHRGCPRH
jgi:flagellar biosynthesis/type III secretory pathway M-ring protein FliF/YscJ